MSPPVLRVEHVGAHTVTLTIDRPHRLNAVDEAVMAALEAALDALEPAPPAVVVLASSGERAFVSGGDLEAFRDLDTAEAASAMARRMSDVLLRLERLPALVVAAVTGAAYGGGCELLLACDRVIAEPDARLGFTQARFGLTPGWGGATRLVERVGAHRALAILVEARVLDAPTALALGLVHDLADDPLARACQLADHLPTTDPALIAALKQVTTARDRTFEQTLEAERAIFVERWLAPLHHARVEAFLEKKPR